MEELRTDINNLDTQAGSLLELINDEYGYISEEDHVQELKDAIIALQDKITAYQEAEGWI